MKNLLCVFFFFFLSTKLFAFSISSSDVQRVAEKIWHNECKSTFDNLTSWKKSEGFPSFGIGHFIWYPIGKKEKFHETFPSLLTFFQNHAVELPVWLLNIQGCPWSSREEFYQNFHSKELCELRQFLFETRHLQAIFLAKRLEDALPQLLQTLPEEEKEEIRIKFYRLANESRGLYALIDYVNFKGEGISPLERYEGQGWGLLQVLQHIPVSSQNCVVDFVAAAKILLIQRVSHSPPERNEKVHLKGWLNRLNTYLYDD